MTFNRSALFAVSFYAGLGTMAFEMVLGRALVPYFGGTIYTWGALIAVFLLGMSFGFFIGGRFADRYPRIGLVSGLLCACGAVILCTPLYAEPLCLALLDAIEDVRIGALVASLAMAFFPALLFAAVSPVAVRLALVDVAHSGSIVGAMSALNTVGSIVGTIGTSFFLVPVIGSRGIFYLLGALTIACAAALFALQRGRRHMAAPAAVALMAAALCAHPEVARAQVSVMAPDGVIEKVESEYNNVFVVKQGQTLYMNFGYRNSQYVESVFDLLDRGALSARYTRYMTLAAVYNERFERAAFVGLGGGRTAS
ncbi:MAG TPA: fused MFS/spermidine synthase, partial [Burkholderiales bacterium]|nr:fused MFS/spermidine synthase [Burkholderiales bacterium]